MYNEHWQSDKKCEHWWSFFDFHPRKEIFLIGSFVFEAFKEFLIQDDQKIINKIFYGVEKFKKKDNKITLVTLRFSIREYKKLRTLANWVKQLNLICCIW